MCFAVELPRKERPRNVKQTCWQQEQVKAYHLHIQHGCPVICSTARARRLVKNKNSAPNSKYNNVQLIPLNNDVIQPAVMVEHDRLTSINNSDYQPLPTMASVIKSDMGNQHTVEEELISNNNFDEILLPLNTDVIQLVMMAEQELTSIIKSDNQSLPTKAGTCDPV